MFSDRLPDLVHDAFHELRITTAINLPLVPPLRADDQGMPTMSSTSWVGMPFHG